MIRLLINQAFFMLACLLMMDCNSGTNKENEPGGITPEEARKIAREAYIYGYPMIDGYRIQHAYFADKDNTEYKAPLSSRFRY